MKCGSTTLVAVAILACAGASQGDITLLSRHSEAFAEFHQPFPFPPNDMPWQDFAEFNEFGDWSVVLEHGDTHADFARTDAIGGEFFGQLQGGNPASLYPYRATGASQNVVFSNPRHRRVSIRFSAECAPCWPARSSSPNLTFKLVNQASGQVVFDIFTDGTRVGAPPRQSWNDQTWDGELPPGTYELTTFGGFEETDYMAGNLFADGTVAFTLTFGETTCPADFNNDEFVDFFDYTAFVQCFEGGECPSGQSSDFNGDGFADFFDYMEFVDAFETGC